MYWDTDVPERFHFRGNRRIGRIVGIADNGWAVVSGGNQGLGGLIGRSQNAFIASATATGFPLLIEKIVNRCFVRIAKLYVCSFAGQHGFDNEFMDMHAVFIASGPAFVNQTEPVPTFANIHVYSLVRLCSLLLAVFVFHSRFFFLFCVLLSHVSCSHAADGRRIECTTRSYRWFTGRCISLARGTASATLVMLFACGVIGRGVWLV